MYGPGQGPNMGPAHGPGPWGRARPGPAYIWAGTFFINCILKNLNIVYVFKSLLFCIFAKKTRAEKSRILVRQMPRDLSYETHLGPKTKTD